MSRTRRNNQLFIVLIIVVAIVFWYGAVFIGTQAHCSNSTEVWVWTPPPHWACPNPFG